MSDRPRSVLRTTLAVPARGQACQVQRGGWQIVLEHARGGLALLAHDGQRSERFFLGVPAQGHLEVCLRAPAFPVEVRLKEIVSLAPGSRLRGYVRVPLPLAVVWTRTGSGAEPGNGSANGHGDALDEAETGERRDPGAAEGTASERVTTELVELVPQGFKTAWLGEASERGYVHRVTSPFLLDARARGGEAEVLVPVVLHNLRESAVSPAQLTVELHAADLRSLRGRLIAAPRRLVFGADEEIVERVRGFPGKAREASG